MRLSPSRLFTAVLSCSLVHRSLDDNIVFEALSYTWGDANLRRYISLDGRKFLVTRNLDIALRHLRYVHDERFLWIDALCINQGDILERNEQVAKMRRIYQRATKVVAWLGPTSHKTDIAFHFLMEASSNRSEIENWFSKTLTNPARLRSWEALYDLIDRDYWKRVWIIQEIFSATTLVVRCGYRSIWWSDFVFLIYMISRKFDLINTEEVRANRLENAEFLFMFTALLHKSYLPASIEDLRKTEANGTGPPSLVALLMTYRVSSCSNPCDKVFGVIGIAQQHDYPPMIKIDYSQSKQQVYVNTARYIIERGRYYEAGPLNIICSSFPHISDGSLPSWVPDWSTTARGIFNDITTMSSFFRANGASLPIFNFEIDREILAVKGFEVATVAHLADLLAPLSGPPLSSTLGSKSMFEMHDIIAAFYSARELAMSREERMPHCDKSLHVRAEEFTRTLILNNGAVITGGPLRVPEEIVREFCQEIMDCTDVIDRWGDVMKGHRGNSNSVLLDVVMRNLKRYRFCVSSGGSFLMAPFQTRRGDIVCVLLGCDMPVVLRKSTGNHCTFIGECYSHGIMYGEAMEELAVGKYEATEFRIY